MDTSSLFVCTMCKIAVQVQIPDFLLSLAYDLKRHFCRSWRDTYVDQFSFMYVKVSSRAAVLGALVSQFALPKTNEIHKF